MTAQPRLWTAAARVRPATARRLAASAASAVLDFLYPVTCVACDTPLEQGGTLCDSCDKGLERLMYQPACLRCGGPRAEGAAGPCPFCQGKGLRPLRGIIRLGQHESPLRELVHALKFRSRWALGATLATQLHGLWASAEVAFAPQLVVPVPLHALRRFFRGYNQAELIARPLAAQMGVPFGEPLIRIKSTPSQRQMHSRTRRRRNMRHAFAVASPRQVQNRHVLLVDDVMTTGATLQSAARALEMAGAASVWAIVLAVADPKGRAFELV